VWWFGFVSLAADMVYEGARSVYGPLLASLGATATVVGLVTGAGEAMALVLRLVFGPLADRTGRYWSLTVLGYGLTAVCVPLLAVTPFVGAAGLALASVLILLERSGKAIRSPSKSALLAHVATAVGRGRGFGVHKALDQVGALAGPLLVAAVIAAAAGAIWPAMAVLALPGAVAMILLAVIRSRVPDPSTYDGTAASTDLPVPQTNSAGRGLRGWFADAVGAHLPRAFFGYALAAGLTTGGLVTFGIIGFHLSVSGLVPVAGVPLVYAAAMGVEALAALGVGLVIHPVSALLAMASAARRAYRNIAAWGCADGVERLEWKALTDLLGLPEALALEGKYA
jgi:MFS family permease